MYIDLAFFDELKNRFKAPGDFAQAYVIAHEVGHHVQHLLGISDQVDNLRRRNPSQANALSVRMELQADCFAGLWAQRANAARQILESGDVEEALAAATAIGDDRLQKQSQGYVVPDTFTPRLLGTARALVQARPGRRQPQAVRYLLGRPVVGRRTPRSRCMDIQREYVIAPLLVRLRPSQCCTRESPAAARERRGVSTTKQRRQRIDGKASTTTPPRQRDPDPISVSWPTSPNP